MLMNSVVEKASEEIFLLLLKMKNKNGDYSTDHLLKIDASLKMLGYLDDRANGVDVKCPELIDLHSDTDTVDDLQSRIDLVYNSLQRMVDAYEGTRH